MPNLSQLLNEARRWALETATSEDVVEAPVDYLIIYLARRSDIASQLEVRGIDSNELVRFSEVYIRDFLSGKSDTFGGTRSVGDKFFKRAVRSASLRIESGEIDSAFDLFLHLIESQKSFSEKYYKKHQKNASSGLESDTGDALNQESFLPDKTFIAERILSNRNSIALFSSAMKLLVSTELAQRRSTIPNEPIEYEHWEIENELLELFEVSLMKISDALVALEAGDMPVEDVLSTGQSSWRPIQRFFQNNGEAWAQSAANVGLVGGGIGIFSYFGVAPTDSIVPLTALITAPAIVNFAGKLDVSVGTPSPTKQETSREE